MKRPPKLSLPTKLSFVVLATATFGGPWVACGSDTSSGGSGAGGSGGSTSSSNDDAKICVLGPDAGPKQKCPDEPAAGEHCPEGCETEVI